MTPKKEKPRLLSKRLFAAFGLRVGAFGGFSAPGGIRTHGLPLRRRSLYPAELRVQARFVLVQACVIPCGRAAIHVLARLGLIIPQPTRKHKGRAPAENVAAQHGSSQNRSMAYNEG